MQKVAHLINRAFMKLPHRTNHDDDDDGDDAKKQHTAPRSIVPLSMFECFKVRQNRLDSGNHQTRYADAACVWQACQFQKAKNPISSIFNTKGPWK